MMLVLFLQCNCNVIAVQCILPTIERRSDDDTAEGSSVDNMLYIEVANVLVLGHFLQSNDVTQSFVVVVVKRLTIHHHYHCCSVAKHTVVMDRRSVLPENLTFGPSLILSGNKKYRPLIFCHNRISTDLFSKLFHRYKSW